VKAYYLHAMGDIRPHDIAEPEPAAGEVLLEVQRVGICGSDLEYYRHGYCGAFVPTAPFVLGHELMGRVVALGEGATRLTVGQRVALNPARPCGRCRYCRSGRLNLCPHMRYLGTASVTPHIDGGLCEYLTFPEANCIAISDRVSDAEAALLEPLAVALHALQRAGSLMGRTVLVSGGGTIGQLVALAAGSFGAASVAVSEPQAHRRRWALDLGADEVVDPLQGPLPSDRYEVVFEASGAGPALDQVIEAIRPGGTIVQIGTLPERVELPANRIMAKELQLLGSFRFTTDFDDALALLEGGRLDVSRIVSATFPFASTPEAFAAAVPPSDELKVQVDLTASTQAVGR
jgi:L-idonate 5-dehydrogenase